MYEVLLERSAERDLKRLSPSDFKRVVAEIKKLSEEPRPRGCTKIQGSQQDYRIRIGDFRVIYEVDDEANEVRVMPVRHSDSAYH